MLMQVLLFLLAGLGKILQNDSRWVVDIMKAIYDGCANKILQKKKKLIWEVFNSVVLSAFF